MCSLLLSTCLLSVRTYVCGGSAIFNTVTFTWHDKAILGVSAKAYALNTFATKQTVSCLLLCRLRKTRYSLDTRYRRHGGRMFSHANRDLSGIYHRFQHNFVFDTGGCIDPIVRLTVSRIYTIVLIGQSFLLSNHHTYPRMML